VCQEHLLEAIKSKSYLKVQIAKAEEDIRRELMEKKVAVPSIGPAFGVHCAAAFGVHYAFDFAQQVSL